MQVQVAQVLQGAHVQWALQVLSHCRAVEHLNLLAHAPALRFGLERAQLVHVRGFHGGMQMATLEVTVDAVARYALLDYLVATPAQVPDEVIDLGAQVVAHL